MKRIKCPDCHKILLYDPFLDCAYDEMWNDAIWDNKRKCWICVDCKYDK